MPSLSSDFWEEKHKKNNKVWLTGTTPDALDKFYNLSDDNLTQKSVLEIGVGIGSCSQKLSARAKQFYAADISMTALEKVAKYTQGTFLTSELKTCPPVDMVICHLVLVHCDDTETLRIINDINLSQDGIAHLQFSELVGAPSDRIRENLIDNGSHHFRNLDKIKQLITSSNKEILKISEPHRPPGYLDYDLKQIWHFVTVRNRNGVTT